MNKSTHFNQNSNNFCSNLFLNFYFHYFHFYLHNRCITMNKDLDLFNHLQYIYFHNSSQFNINQIFLLANIILILLLLFLHLIKLFISFILILQGDYQMLCFIKCIHQNIELYFKAHII